ncbi:hypothetical protein F5Y14DRAFT_450034 [Nemania sp. NC0429]|nr:hypothetical protein F5Y14DRAFT_450034 [Nemania sp. NC0429]
MTDNTDHGEFIAVLREFYTLLSRLGVVPFEMLQLPDPNTGVHPEGAINTEAASAGGFAPETVRLMTMLPYLAVGQHDWSLQLLPSTHPITYLGADLEEGDFRSQRELLHDVEMPPSAIRLTWSDNYGTEFIYDTATKLMVAWEPFQNPDEVYDYAHVAGASPREVLAPVIEDYKRLRHIAIPDRVEFSSSFFADSGGVPPREWSAREQRSWKRAYDIWEAMQKLRDFYLECGWDMDGDVDQKDFRLDEFLAKREAYMRDVLGPLIEAE